MTEPRARVSRLALAWDALTSLKLAIACLAALMVLVVGCTLAQVELAFAACRSINFATENAVRHGGEYSLNDLLAADKLAREALDKKGK